MIIDNLIQKSCLKELFSQLLRAKQYCYSINSTSKMIFLSFFNLYSRLLRIVSASVLLSLLFFPKIADAQEDNSDNILWSGVQFQKSVDDWTFHLRPIVRFDQNFGSYSNSSIDLAVKKKFGSNWNGQIIARTWFMPGRSDRQFIWSNISHTAKIPALGLSMTNRLRWHLAIDVNGVFDPDFLRHIISFVPTKSSKVKPYFGFESWYQFNGFNSLRRFRIEPGIKASLSDQLGLNVIWQRQLDVNREFKRQDNLWVVNLVVKL